VAAQLSKERFSSLFSGASEVRLPRHALPVACVVAVIASIASLLVGTWDAQRDEEAARRQYADVRMLLAQPPVVLSQLEEERDAALASRDAAQALLEPPSVDLSSDAGTVLLVERAGDAGLVVRAISRLPASQVKNGELAYDVQAVRITVEGSVSQLLAFLFALDDDEPGVLPTLETLTVSERNAVRAELTFSTFSAAATPAAAPPAGASP
jgi:hypothetical protein